MAYLTDKDIKGLSKQSQPAKTKYLTDADFSNGKTNQKTVVQPKKKKQTKPKSTFDNVVDFFTKPARMTYEGLIRPQFNAARLAIEEPMVRSLAQKQIEAKNKETAAKVKSGKITKAQGQVDMLNRNILLEKMINQRFDPVQEQLQKDTKNYMTGTTIARSMGSALTTYIPRFAGDVTELVGNVGQAASMGNKDIKNIFKPISKTGHDISKWATETGERAFLTKDDNEIVKGLAFSTGELLGDILLGKGITKLGKVVPAATSTADSVKRLIKTASGVVAFKQGSNVFNDTYRKAKSAGMTDGDAFIRAAPNAIIQGIVEKFGGVQKYLKPIAKSKILSFITNSIMEGSEEAIQQMADNITDMTVVPPKDMPELLNRLFAGTAEAFGGGALIGGAASGAMIATDQNISPDQQLEQTVLEAEQPKPKGSVKKIEVKTKPALVEKPSTPQVTKTEVSKPSIKEAVPEMDLETARILRGTKGMTADDIMRTNPDIKLKREVPATDIYGNKVKIPDGEVLTPYELKGNKILLQDGETYIVSKSQYQNIQSQSKVKETREFAPELKTVEESVMGTQKPKTDADIKWTGDSDNLVGKLDNREFGINKEDNGYYVFEKNGLLGTKTRNYTEAVEALNRHLAKNNSTTKYQQYTLPDGKNYKEILIKSKSKNDLKKSGELKDKAFADFDAGKITVEERNKILDSLGDYNGQDFQSGHWDEPNVIAHLRMNERTYKGKKVAFMEELQSDWAKEGRDKGFATGKYAELDARRIEIENKGNNATSDEKAEWADINNKLTKESSAIPNNPLLKKWQELAIKRALKEAVDSKAEYFSWITGDQTSARYDLAKQIDDVKWKQQGKLKLITVNPKGNSGAFDILTDADGKVIKGGGQTAQMEGKRVDEIFGKGLADKIMAGESGTLSGDGLKLGGEWANNLYDKQVGNIVSDLTGAKIEELDLGLPVEGKKDLGFMNFENGRMTTLTEAKDLAVGKTIIDKNGFSYIVTEVIKDGKFKAMMGSVLPQSIPTSDKDLYIEAATGYAKKGSGETFDISANKTTQQGIRLTSEIKAIIQGKAPKWKASGVKFDEPTTLQVAKVEPKPKGTVKSLKRQPAKIEVKAKGAVKPLKVKVISTVGTPKLAQRVKSDAIENKMVYGFDKKFNDMPDYDKANMKDQYKKATEFVLNDTQNAIDVAMGIKSAPDGILNNMVWRAAKDYAIQTNDINLMLQLQHSDVVTQATGMGQEIKALDENDPYSPVSNAMEIKAAREKAVKRKTGKTISEESIKIKKEVKAKTPKLTKQSLSEFIASLEC